ncbi:MAG: hypothetical protein JWP66_1399 [Naasia sp.]|nr:hypothetical protein [Naasia sp.]
MSEPQDVPQSKQYLAEFLDGPFAGRTEHRFLVDGAHDDEISEMAAIGGQERLFWYVAGESHDFDGLLHVKYTWDRRDSDDLQDTTDVESRRF